MKKAISLESVFPDAPFYERFRMVREMGFSYVELGAWLHLDLSRVGELLRQHDLQLSCLGGMQDYLLEDPEEREDFFEHLSQSLAIAKSLGCGCLSIRSPINADALGKSGGGQGDFAKIAIMTRTLLDAAEKAAKANSTLLLQPIGNCGCSISETDAVPFVCDTIKMVNSPNLRLLYDVTQMRATEVDIVCAVRKYRAIIGYVRIGNAAAATGACELDLMLFRNVLANEIGYDGFVGFEFRYDRDDCACLDVLKDF